MPLAEYDGNGAHCTTFIYGGRWTPVAFIRNGVTDHIVTDQLGSSRLVLDASGAVVKCVDYNAFGNVVLDMPALDLHFGFAGGMSDLDHELVRFSARDYQPSTGRWADRDPVLLAGGANLYCDVANDPIDRLDQLGLGETLCTISNRFGFSWMGVHLEYNQIDNVRSTITGTVLPTGAHESNQQNIRRTVHEPIRPHL